MRDINKIAEDLIMMSNEMSIVIERTLNALMVFNEEMDRIIRELTNGTD